MDKVEDPRDISGISRFLSGGIGGISSQLSTSLFLAISFSHSFLMNFDRYLSGRDTQGAQINFVVSFNIDVSLRLK